MADAKLSSNALAWVGSPTWIQPLAERGGGDNSFLRSLNIAGTTATDSVSVLGSEGIEAIVNQYGLDVSGDILYDKDLYGTLTDHQSDRDNVMVVVFDDYGADKRHQPSDVERSCYVLPCSWSGVPLSNPTNSLITTSVSFLLNGAGIDGGVVPNSYRAREILEARANTGGDGEPPQAYNDWPGGKAETGWWSGGKAADRMWLVVTKWVQAGSQSAEHDFVLQDSSSAAVSEVIELTGTTALGIHEISFLTGKTAADVDRFSLAAPNTNKLRGWLVAGTEMEID